MQAISDEFNIFFHQNIEIIIACGLILEYIPSISTLNHNVSKTTINRFKNGVE